MVDKLKIFKRIKHIQLMTRKYSHCWNNGECSTRMIKWDLEYTKIIEEHRDIFNEYCLEHGQSPEHNWIDLLA